jgi:hypothetical protein
MFSSPQFGTAEEAAEKVEKQIPRGLKPARNDKNKGLSGTTEVVPFQNPAKAAFFRSL